MKSTPITIITGRSGAGKSTALAAFEDSGHYCVDNMPVALLPEFLNLSKDKFAHVLGLVFGMDLRENNFIRRYETVLHQLKAHGFHVRIIFVEADEKTLLRRYSQTRRRHPMAGVTGVYDAIQAEKTLLAALRRQADHIIDTSDLNVHELKSIIRKIADAGTQHGPMQVQVLSFGFKFGLPVHADLVMDVRFLKNPYFVESLRPLSGETEKIRSFVLNNDQTCLFLHKYFDLLDILIPQYENEGKSYLTIAIGCTGGRHRSVVIAGQLHEHIQASGRTTELTHRDIDKSLSK
ncbi:nucleotide-binding protein [Desulfosarcina alkanivorans]|uniref:Nucleotide-binding protein n=1 Tax=Desulfosarcina alkanivorans TaxID=571177 RepID=A0A5K7YD23_9BACT|nr:RNase adapter RapZ [Desulfosarcina alkanivorans]BBO66533.1 nucleotide-binding protein [Desulfosarcina alkanivorans]